jgi:hypothetical protein
VLSLPPAFALSQDQTLKLDLKLLNRLITTFDEVPPYLLNAIHIANNAISMKRSWCNLCKRVPPKSFVQPQFPSIQVVKPKSSGDRDSQGLRRPRFSFFIFTCQTARDPEIPASFAGSLQPLVVIKTKPDGERQPTVIGC